MLAQDTQSLALELMVQHGLSGWTFRFIGTIKTLARCVYPEGDVPGSIELSQQYASLNGVAEVRDTILHEIAHALTEGDGHGPRWAAMCRELGCAPSSRKKDAILPRGSWGATCGGCGNVLTRCRRPKFGLAYYCKTCGPSGGVLCWDKIA